ncbi:hypothetical protein ACWDZ6_05175 [Streptomyces sp. NPDC002926]
MAARFGEAPGVPETDVGRRREVVEAFFAASRGGDFDMLLVLLDPEVVLLTDTAAALPGAGPAIRLSGAPLRRAGRRRAG